MYNFYICQHPVATAPTNLMAVQEGLTSIRVSWYSHCSVSTTVIVSDSSDSVDVSGGSTDNYLLTGLVMGATYTISIEVTSQHIPSGRVETIITLCEIKRTR